MSSGSWGIILTLSEMINVQARKDTEKVFARKLFISHVHFILDKMNTFHKEQITLQLLNILI